ncbi:carbonyl reductase [Hordeum vulgare]|nr:carbonyl reductase [Hordeum vulgare]
MDLVACDEAAVGVAVVAAWRCFGDGGLDALVNCSSYDAGEVQDCLSVSEDEYNKTMKVNVITPWLPIKAMAKRFRDAQSGGSVVCLTQIIGAERGLYPGAAAYATSLGVVHQLVRLSAMELSKHKIRVNAVCHVLHLGDKFPVYVGEEKAEKATGEEMPLRRWLDPDKDLASTVLYLVGDEGSSFFLLLKIHVATLLPLWSVSIVYTMIGDVFLYIVGKDEYDELARKLLLQQGPLRKYVMPLHLFPHPHRDLMPVAASRGTPQRRTREGVSGIDASPVVGDLARLVNCCFYTFIVV